MALTPHKREAFIVAQKVEVTLIDDLDNGKADETITFGLDGTQYEIDLSSANAKKLRSSLTRYVDAARKDSAARSIRRVGRKTAPSGPNTADVREWAKATGIEVSDRGRISADVVVKFQEAHA